LLASKYWRQVPTKTQIEHETVERLRVALAVTARHLRSTEAGEGLTPTELSILATISRRGSLRLTELAEIERVNPTMLSRIAGRLAEARLISREPSAARASPHISTTCPTTTFTRCSQRSRHSKLWQRACAATLRATPTVRAREPG
jgi:MarR family